MLTTLFYHTAGSFEIQPFSFGFLVYAEDLEWYTQFRKEMLSMINVNSSKELRIKRANTKFL